MATVQDYLNLAISGTISNQTKTDVEFQLPNDIRKLSDLKVDAWSVKRQTVAAGATGTFNVVVLLPSCCGHRDRQRRRWVQRLVLWCLVGSI